MKIKNKSNEPKKFLSKFDINSKLFIKIAIILILLATISQIVLSFYFKNLNILYPIITIILFTIWGLINIKKTRQKILPILKTKLSLVLIVIILISSLIVVGYGYNQESEINEFLIEKYSTGLFIFGEEVDFDQEYYQELEIFSSQDILDNIIFVKNKKSLNNPIHSMIIPDLLDYGNSTRIAVFIVHLNRTGLSSWEIEKFRQVSFLETSYEEVEEKLKGSDGSQKYEASSDFEYGEFEPEFTIINE